VDARTLLRAEIDANIGIGSCAARPSSRFNPTTLVEATALVCSETTALLCPTPLIESATLVCSETAALLNPTPLLDICPATLQALSAAGIRTTLAGHFTSTH
jgi:hypothetical protein